MKNLLLLVMLALGFGLGCKKEDKGPGLNSDPCLVDSTFTIHYKYPIIAYPKVNPNNPNEIAFIKDKYFSSCCDIELLIFNIETKEQRVIYKGSPKNLDWSAKDWIIFLNNDDKKIYKIRSSGDSLIQLTNEKGRYPIWSLSGEKFIYQYIESFSPQIAGLKICSDKGEVFQTYPDVYAFYDTWQHDSLLAFVNSYSPDYKHVQVNLFTISELDTGPYHGKASILDGGMAQGCEWIDNENLIVASSKGIYQLVFSNNFKEYEVIPIKESCSPDGHSFIGYSNPTLARQAKQVIFQKTNFEITGEKEAIHTTRFVRMNLDGTGEKVIEIPGL